MKATVTAKIVLALLMALACAGLCASGALAATGGISAGSASRRATRVHTTALATWFGPGFYGRETACGQTMTPEILGVANRTLPCGTLVKISYRGRHIVVPVIDRGPYSRADWDLTAQAALALGVEDTARIRTRVVGSMPNTPTLGAPAVPAVASAAGGASAG